eukprot:6174685-Amphidinium_carterae.1
MKTLSMIHTHTLSARVVIQGNCDWAMDPLRRQRRENRSLSERDEPMMYDPKYEMTSDARTSNT